MRACIRPGLAAAALILAQQAVAQPLPSKLDYDGRFTVTYHPIMCNVPPCPPGSYAIVAENRRIGTARRLEIDPATAAELRKVLDDTRPYYTGLSIDGHLQLSQDESRTATILARRAIPGQWKP